MPELAPTAGVERPGAHWGAYGRRFYERQQAGSRRSAEHTVPLLIDLLHPGSVVDVGCGVGTWLAVFGENHVDDHLGIDGPHVEPSMLQVDSRRFLARDLTAPLALDRAFDLVVSLEVAEHLPASAAATFVESLVGLGPVVAFSAAVPGSGGQHHVNEQWPDYWAALFGEHGYHVVDCVRRRLWSNAEVDWWYAQNLLLYVRPEVLAENPRLREGRAGTDLDQLAIVHPRLLDEVVERGGSLRHMARLAPWAVMSAVGRRIGRRRR